MLKNAWYKYFTHIYIEIISIIIRNGACMMKNFSHKIKVLTAVIISLMLGASSWPALPIPPMIIIPGLEFADDGTDCSHEHDDECGYLSGEPCDHICGDECARPETAEEEPPDATDDGDAPVAPDAPDAPDTPLEASVTIMFAGFGGALYLPQGVKMTEADLLEGVFAYDENGGPVEVILTDTDGLNMDDPRPRGYFPPSPYIISYAAVHPEDGSVTAAATREAYVTISFMTAASDLNWINNAPPSPADGDTVILSGLPTGVLRVPNNATVNVTGSVAGATAGVTVELLGPNAKVIWNATFVGATATTAAYILSISGNGTVELSSCSIGNTRSGGAVHLAGAATLIVGDGAAVYSSGTNGNAVLATADGATVNVEYGGYVESAQGNGNAAIQIGGGSGGGSAMNVKINVNGGAVASIGSGYAINDSAGTGTVENNTLITVNDGAVTAGANSAIYSTGMNSKVIVNGGAVTNAASTNLNPAIQMNGGVGDNVTVNGGAVRSTSSSGYALQTTGNAIINGGAVSAEGSGRAINLVGMNSKATVNGGEIRANGTGAAISTATTNPGTVTNASITVEGGMVFSSGGAALNITGAESKITVSGGEVSSNAGHAINAEGANSNVVINGVGVVTAVTGNAINAVTAAANAKVTVAGNARVSSSTGRAIQTLGGGSTVTVDGASQVWVCTTGNAIRSNGSVVLPGGFVFAYGSNASGVINTTPAVPAGSTAMVVAWDRAAGVRTYQQGYSTSSNPNLSISWNGQNSDLWWHNHPVLGGGIAYRGSLFFPLPEVSIIRDFGLIFDSSTGFMYANVNRTGIPLDGNYRVFPMSFGNIWIEAPGVLTLRHFSWNTTAPIALTIINGDAEIVLEDYCHFASNNPNPPYPQGVSAGIYAAGALKITVTGDGELNVVGGAASSGGSYGVCADNFIIESGTVEAIGYTSAFKNKPGLPQVYRWWTGGQPSQPTPAGDGTIFCTAPPADYGDEYEHYASDRYTKVAPIPFPVAVVSKTAVTGAMGAALSKSAVITLYGVVAASLTGADASGWFAKRPGGVTITANSTAGDHIINLAFNGVPTEGLSSIFDITIPGGALEGSALKVLYEPEAFFDIQSVYDLYVVAGTGGRVSIIGNGGSVLAGPVYGTAVTRLPSGESVAVKAEAGSEYYRFTGWTALSSNVTLDNAQSSAANFIMPANSVIITAEFERLYTLTVNGGAISAAGGPTSGIFAAGDQITLVGEDFGVDISPGADLSLPAIFSRWLISYDAEDGATFVNTNSKVVTFTMPESDAVANARFREINPGLELKLTVINGSDTTRSAPYSSGDQVKVSAVAPSDGYEFKNWTILTNRGSFDDYTKPDAIFTMPGRDSVIRAEFERIVYNLNVIDGTYDASAGPLYAGTRVTVTATPHGSEYVFDCWTVVGGGVILNSSLMTTEFIMPAANATVKANFFYVGNDENGGTDSGTRGDAGGGSAAGSSTGSTAAAAAGPVAVEYKHISYVAGIGGGLFAPEANLTRAHAAQMFFNLLTNKNISAARVFTDVKNGEWFAAAVGALASVDIITGYPDGSYHPGDGITRAEFVTLATRFIGGAHEYRKMGMFADVPASHWAYQYINSAAVRGWIQGVGNGLFEPDRQITRAEAVTLTNKLLEREPDRVFIDSNTAVSRFADVPKPHWAYYEISEAYNAHMYTRQSGHEKWERRLPFQ